MLKCTRESMRNRDEILFTNYRCFMQGQCICMATMVSLRCAMSTNSFDHCTFALYNVYIYLNICNCSCVIHHCIHS